MMKPIPAVLFLLSMAAGVSAREGTARSGDLIAPNWSYGQNGSIELEAGDLPAAREAVLKVVQSLSGQITNINEQTRSGRSVDAVYMTVVVSSAAVQTLFHEVRKLGNVVQSNLPGGMGPAQQEEFLAQVERLRAELAAFKGDAPVLQKVAAEKLREWDNFLTNQGRAMNGTTITITVAKSGTRAKQYGRNAIGRDLFRLAMPLAAVVVVLLAAMLGGLFLGRQMFRKPPA